MHSRLILAGLALLLIGAGEPRQPDGRPLILGPDNWGEANRQTYAAQIIDPVPAYETAVPESSGEHTAEALKRYHSDTVKQPAKASTTTNVTGGSGGGK